MSSINGTSIRSVYCGLLAEPLHQPLKISITYGHDKSIFLYNPVEKLKRASGNEHAHRKIEEKLEVFVPLSILWRCGSIL
jgi:hypothetical protein